MTRSPPWSQNPLWPTTDGNHKYRSAVFFCGHKLVALAAEATKISFGMWADGLLRKGWRWRANKTPRTVDYIRFWYGRIEVTNRCSHRY